MSDSKRKRKCFKCGATDNEVVLHRFPKPGVRNVIRAELWAKFVFPDGPWSSQAFQSKLYSEHRMLCSKHFKHADFIDYSQQKLTRTAAPSIDCNQVETLEPQVKPGPSCEILVDITNTKPNSNTEQMVGVPVEKENIPRKSTPSLCEIPHVTATSETVLRTYKKVNTIDPHVKPGPSRGIMSAIPHPPGVSEPLEELYKVMEANKEAKERKYYRKSRKHMRKICKMRKTINKLKNKDLLRKVSGNDSINRVQKLISPAFSVLLQSQITNYTKKPKGRRWTHDDKIMALRIYKKSPSCYRLLRRLQICLPAPSSLKKLLSTFNMPSGISKNVLNCLKKHSETQKNLSDREFILMFDEMSIKKHIIYNIKSDVIDGFQDHGPHGRSPQEAVKALVFMLAGIRKPVKQPLAYYLSGANVTADRLSVLIKETLHDCFDAGLQVSATVCDMGGTNRRALTSLGATENYPVIKIDEREIVTLFDAPHLLKCFRNMFLKYDIQCKTDITSISKSGEGVAKWSHIKNFYGVDNMNPNFVFAPSLKKEHLDPNAKQKMKVNLAAQVLSHTVAAGIFSKASTGELPADAIVTANVLSKMDKLFDLVNSDTPDLRRGKPYATNMSKSSPHKKYFQEMKFFFKNISFIGCTRPPPSIEGWIWTLNGIEILWAKMQNYRNVESLATRRLQQDPLENLFGCIRSNCGCT